MSANIGHSSESDGCEPNANASLFLVSSKGPLADPTIHLSLSAANSSSGNPWRMPNSKSGRPSAAAAPHLLEAIDSVDGLSKPAAETSTLFDPEFQLQND
jgi:hypothetical protein